MFETDLTDVIPLESIASIRPVLSEDGFQRMVKGRKKRRVMESKEEEEEEEEDEETRMETFSPPPNMNGSNRYSIGSSLPRGAEWRYVETWESNSES